jgi:hypothetical protein
LAIDCALVPPSFAFAYDPAFTLGENRFGLRSATRGHFTVRQGPTSWFTPMTLLENFKSAAPTPVLRAKLEGADICMAMDGVGAPATAAVIGCTRRPRADAITAARGTDA